jgi:hypothetical protein
MDFLGIGELRSLGELSSFEKCLNVLQNQQFVFFTPRDESRVAFRKNE